MNLLAMAFIALGYTVFYWSANQIKHWNRSVTDTEAATFKLLAGFPMDSDYQTIHAIPFPYTDPNPPSAPNSKPETNPGTSIDPRIPSAPQNKLSPTYPGGPGGTIPTPTIPGINA